jgi:hypothetical protein
LIQDLAGVYLSLWAARQFGTHLEKRGSVRVLGYLDAGSGSMIASAVAAGAAGVAVVFKVGARKTMSALSPKKRKAARQADDTPDVVEPDVVETASDAQPS